MKVLLFCTIVALFTGCSSPSQQQSAEKYKGREETKKLESVSAVGYDGAAVRKSVDNTLDKTDDRNQDMDKALKMSNEEERKQ